MSEGYEKQDVALFVSWGADMLKVDACGTQEPPQMLVARWSKLLNESGRRVLFSNCHNGCESQHGRGGWSPWCAADANMWRSSQDIQPTWSNMLVNLDSLKGRGAFGAPGRWNDPDFLEIGIGEFALSAASGGGGVAMNQAHMAMWCVTSSPLIAGLPFDQGPQPQALLAILTNQAAIAVDQTYVGNAGDFVRTLQPEGPGQQQQQQQQAGEIDVHTGAGVAGEPKPKPKLGVELWAKPQAAHSAAVAVLNRGPNATTTALSFQLGEVPGLPAGATACSVRDVWTGATRSATGGQFSVAAGLAGQSALFVLLSDCKS